MLARRRSPVSSRKRSASVDLPWSMWAMIEKLRMRSMGERPSTARPGGPVAAGRSAAPATAHEAPDLLRLGDPKQR